MGLPKNTCAVELPTEGFVGLEWVKAVMETKYLIKGLLLRESGVALNSENGHDSGVAPLQQAAEICNVLVQNCLELLKDHRGFDDVVEKLDLHFPEGNGVDEICNELKALLQALFPKRNFKVGNALNTL